MKVLHVIDSYSLRGVEVQDIFVVKKGYSDYIRFLHVLKNNSYDVVHIQSVGTETFGIYALIAWTRKLKVVRTLYAPVVFSYWYTIKQLCSRFFYSHTIVTSKFDLMCIDKYHIAPKGKRSLIYKGVDQKSPAEIIKKETARLFLYKKIGIGFTKTIRIIGTIIGSDSHTGVEHLIDAAYLADKYKNLTNTIFIILSSGKIEKNVVDQIAKLPVEGITFVIGEVENPEEYMKAFDILISPREKAGDISLLLAAHYMQVPIIATKVGDVKELESFVAAPLVPPQSAKFLTEAFMYVIQNMQNVKSKKPVKDFVLLKKFTVQNEKDMTKEIYTRVLQKRKVSRRK